MLRLRGKIYMVRTFIPTSLQALLGRSEITRSLRTPDRREALRRLHIWETHVGRLLKIVSRMGVNMTRDELDRLVAQYVATTFDQIEARLALEWEEPGLDVHRWALSDRAYLLAGALSNANPEGALALAKELAPDASGETLRRLARRLIEVQLEGVKGELRALSGESLGRPVASTEVQAEPQVTTVVTPKLSELAQQYGDERVARKRWTARTEIQYRGYLSLLTTMLGDPPVGEVTKETMRRLGLELIALPANLSKRYPGLSPREALEVAKDDPSVPRLAPASVNAHYQAIRSFFNWAVDHDHLQQNPATVLKDVKTGRASADRLPFDDDDLRLYFAKLDSKQNRQPFEYWIPRIMAFSGCRLGEVAQLRVEDVRQEKGCWVLDINEDEPDKHLKTESSRRLVPLHPRLLELELPAFAAAAPPGFLWPADMRTAQSASQSAVDRLQKRLAYSLRAAGVTHPKKTAAHSFRHTLAARLKSLSVPQYQIAEILGHEVDSMTTGRYGTTTDLETLKSAISLLKLPI